MGRGGSSPLQRMPGSRLVGRLSASYVPCPPREAALSTVRTCARVGVNRSCQIENLPGQVEQFVILLILLLNGVPLLVGHHLAPGIGSGLADHHERGEKDRL